MLRVIHPSAQYLDNGLSENNVAVSTLVSVCCYDIAQFAVKKKDKHSSFITQQC